VESKFINIHSEKQIQNLHSCFSGNLLFKEFYKIAEYVYCLPQCLFIQPSIQFYDFVCFNKSVYLFSFCIRMENIFTCCMLLLYSCMGMQWQFTLINTWWSDCVFLQIWKDNSADRLANDNFDTWVAKRQRMAMCKR
jgi:hypothetical protein